MNAEVDAKVITYRLFWTNCASRIVTVPDMVDAQDDVEAVREAERLAKGRNVEVWNPSRRVAMLNGSQRH